MVQHAVQNIVSSGAAPQGGVLALGNFDGVHRGHQAVLQAALAYASEQGLPARVLTLEPHPRSLLSAPQKPFRLTPASVKNRLLQAMGIDDIITLNFSPDFAQQSAKDFVEQILVQHYHAKHVVAGANFVFGHERAGTMPQMKEWLKPHGIGVTVVPPLLDDKGQPISSSLVREVLQKGNLDKVRELLGRPWSISGIIVRGAKRGSVIGIPTANMELGDYARPPHGVYAVMARRVGSEKALPGVANIGTRPTVGSVREMLEFHVFQPQSDLYDQEWEVALYHFLRPEETFSSLEALQEQIRADMEMARVKLGTAHA